MGEMKYEDFNDTLTLEQSPAKFKPVLKALWFCKKGDWEKAHDIAQGVPTSLGSAIHAYLHRLEGDQANANYWYSQAGREPYSGSLEGELESLLLEALD